MSDKNKNGEIVDLLDDENGEPDTEQDKVINKPETTETQENRPNDNPQDKVKEDAATQQDPLIKTVEFVFNRNVKLDNILIKAGESVEVTLEEAEMFEGAKLGQVK